MLHTKSDVIVALGRLNRDNILNNRAQIVIRRGIIVRLLMMAEPAIAVFLLLGVLFMGYPDWIASVIHTMLWIVLVATTMEYTALVFMYRNVPDLVEDTISNPTRCGNMFIALRRLAVSVPRVVRLFMGLATIILLHECGYPVESTILLLMYIVNVFVSLVYVETALRNIDMIIRHRETTTYMEKAKNASIKVPDSQARH